jgi:PT repeat
MKKSKKKGSKKGASDRLKEQSRCVVMLTQACFLVLQHRVRSLDMAEIADIAERAGVSLSFQLVFVPLLTYVLSIDAAESSKSMKKSKKMKMTMAPTKKPTKAPTKAPTKKPTKAPTKKPTKAPTKAPVKGMMGMSGSKKKSGSKKSGSKKSKKGTCFCPDTAGVPPTQQHLHSTVITEKSRR